MIVDCHTHINSAGEYAEGYFAKMQEVKEGMAPEDVDNLLMLGSPSPEEVDVQIAAAVEGERRLAAEKMRAREELALLEASSPYAQGAGGTEGMSEIEKIHFEYNEKLYALQNHNTQVIQEMIRSGASQSAIEAKYADLKMKYAEKEKKFKISAAGKHLDPQRRDEWGRPASLTIHGVGIFIGNLLLGRILLPVYLRAGNYVLTRRFR